MKKTNSFRLFVAISSLLICNFSTPQHLFSNSQVLAQEPPALPSKHTDHSSRLPSHKQKQENSDSFSDEAAGLIESIFLIFVLWIIVVNTAPVRRWQMYKRLKGEVFSLPDSDLAGLVTIPTQVAHSAMIGLNGSNEFTVSAHLDLVPTYRPLYRAALHGSLWYHKFLNSDAGIIEHSAADWTTPVLTRQFFLLGEHSPVWKLLAILPYGRFSNISYEKSVDGKLFLVVVCPFFRLTGLGTLVPSRGFALMVSPNGIPSLISLQRAEQLFPHMPLFPAKLVREYALAYAQWSHGFVGRLLKRSKPLGFFEYAYESLAEARLERFRGIGNQFTIFLGPDKGHGGALNAVLTFDERTGQARIFKRADNKIIIGPKEAIAVVRNTYGRGHHQIAAPHLIVHSGKFYWLVVLLSALQEDEGIAILGHYLIDACSGDFVQSLGQRAVLDNGINSITEALRQTTATRI